MTQKKFMQYSLAHATQKEVDEFVAGLHFEPLCADSPELGDVIKYADGTYAFVGTSSHVSYGARDEMVGIARIYPRDISREEESAAGDEEGGG